MRRLSLGLALLCLVGCGAAAPAVTVTSSWPQVTRVVMPEDLDRGCR